MPRAIGGAVGWSSSRIFDPSHCVGTLGMLFNPKFLCICNIILLRFVKGITCKKQPCNYIIEREANKFCAIDVKLDVFQTTSQNFLSDYIPELREMKPIKNFICNNAKYYTCTNLI